MNRVRAALLRLSPPWRRRPIVLGNLGSVTATHVRYSLDAAGTWTFTDGGAAEVTTVDLNAAAERDPTDEAGA